LVFGCGTAPARSRSGATWRWPLTPAPAPACGPGLRKRRSCHGRASCRMSSACSGLSGPRKSQILPWVKSGGLADKYAPVPAVPSSLLLLFHLRSTASAWGSQKVISMVQYRSMAVDSFRYGLLQLTVLAYRVRGHVAVACRGACQVPLPRQRLRYRLALATSGGSRGHGRGASCRVLPPRPALPYCRARVSA